MTRRRYNPWWTFRRCHRYGHLLKTDRSGRVLKCECDRCGVVLHHRPPMHVFDYTGGPCTRCGYDYDPAAAMAAEFKRPYRVKT